MQRRIIWIIGVLAIVCAPRLARAHDGPGGNLGLGFGVGSPTGISLDVASRPLSTFEIALGVDAFEGADGYAHLVFEQGLAELAHGATVAVPVYIGVGPFMASRDRRLDSDFDLGVRVPIGIDFDFQRSPLQAFVEVALNAPIVAVNAGGRTTADVGGYAGLRVWF
jgi:hypothetical protein